MLIAAKGQCRPLHTKGGVLILKSATLRITNPQITHLNLPWYRTFSFLFIPDRCDDENLHNSNGSMIIDAHDRLHRSGLSQLHKLFRQSGNSLGKVALRKFEITHTINLRTGYRNCIKKSPVHRYIHMSHINPKPPPRFTTPHYLHIFSDLRYTIVKYITEDH